MCAECEKAKILKYKGYSCSYSYCPLLKQYFGKCFKNEPLFILKTATFADLEQGFRHSIESHLAFFAEIGL